MRLSCFIYLFIGLNLWQTSFGAELVESLKKNLQQLKQIEQLKLESKCVEKFNDLEEVVRFICNGEHSNLQQELQERGAQEIIEKSTGDMTLGQFVESYEFFKNTNDSVQKPHKGKWTLKQPVSEKDICSYKASSPKIIQEYKFDKLSFQGIQHYYQLSPPDRKTLQSQLISRISLYKTDALILEGNEFGYPLNCEKSLMTVFTPDEVLPSEAQLLVKVGFKKKIALIGGDNQRIDPGDLELVFDQLNEKEKKELKKKLSFIDVLHSYYSQLQRGSKAPLADALKEGSRFHDDPFTEKSFKNFYTELNQRELPTDSRQIYEDFTPSVFTQSPKGSNKITDLQDQLRNQSLLYVVERVSKQYGSPTVVFGSGHLSYLGKSMEEYLGKVKNVDWKGVCP